MKEITFCLVIIFIFWLSAVAHESDIIRQCAKEGKADMSLWISEPIKCSKTEEEKK